MSDPLSLHERTRRIVRRLQTLQQFLDWTEAEDGAESPRAGFWEGLSDILHDIAHDVEAVQRAPFPLSEWRGQTWAEFRDEYDESRKS